MKVNERNMRTWVDALRSGQYPQARQQLKNEDGYCCLGVACEVSGLGKWEPDASGRNYYLGSAMGLPGQVMEWLGFPVDPDQKDCIIMVDTPEAGRVTVVTMNDTQHASFNTIADALEESYL